MTRKKVEDRANPTTIPVEAVGTAELEPTPNAAPDPPSTPGLPVPAAAGPALTPPTPPTTPLAPVQSWAVPVLP